ncbi:MAG: PTS sugar transporter subunit IIA, partial [Planctomycetes bacterium]|nr:PTS sugar transporter subunit IIA [Planctomycetota bacterium]
MAYYKRLPRNSTFGLRASFVIRHLAFVIRPSHFHLACPTPLAIMGAETNLGKPSEWRFCRVASIGRRRAMELSDVLSEDRILLNLTAKDKLDAIRQMARLAVTVAGIRDEAELVRKILDRESIQSTA